MRLLGYIVRYFPERGFGFVAADTEKGKATSQDYFFHFSQAISSAVDIFEGARVAFSLEYHPKGVIAVELKVLG